MNRIRPRPDRPDCKFPVEFNSERDLKIGQNLQPKIMALNFLCTYNPLSGKAVIVFQWVWGPRIPDILQISDTCSETGQVCVSTSGAATWTSRRSWYVAVVGRQQITCAVCQGPSRTTDLLGTLGRTLSRHLCNRSGFCSWHLSPSHRHSHGMQRPTMRRLDRPDCWHGRLCCLYSCRVPGAEFLHRNIIISS